MTEKTDDEAKARLEKLADEVIHLDELSHKNLYHFMLRVWLETIIIVAVALSLFGVAVFAIHIEVVPSVYQDVAPVIFGATITVNGIMIGFASVTGFNTAKDFVEELRELTQFSEILEKKFSSPLR